MRETLSLTTTISSTTATVSNTRDLFAGMYVYGPSVPVCAKVASITNTTTLELSVAATATGTDDHLFADMNPNQYLEVCQAKMCVVDAVDELGKMVQIIVRDETNVTRGKYRSIQRRQQTPSFWIKCYPVEYGPGTLALEKAGLREEVDVTIWTPVKTWEDNGYEWKDIDSVRVTVKVDGETYEIKDRARRAQIHNDWLYYTLGLFKK